ncbi:MAG: hypothetical protein AB1439_00770 [candidate division FCPU426 bacterium]
MNRRAFIQAGLFILASAVLVFCTALSCTRVPAPLAPVPLTPLPIATPGTATPTLTRTPAPTPANTPTPLPTPVGHFQNFEIGNGTQGAYYGSLVNCTAAFTTTVYEGARALEVSFGVGAPGQVRIYPASSPLDLSSHTNIWMMVNDSVGEQGFNMILTSSSGSSQMVGSASATNPGGWTMIYWNLGPFDVDLTDIIYFTIQPYSQGLTFRFDDVRFGSF